MSSKPCDPPSKLKSGDAFGSLTSKLHQLRKQIQAERVIAVKEKLEKNRQVLEQHVSKLVSVTSKENVLAVSAGMLASRIQSPLYIIRGFPLGSGDRDYVDSQEVVFSINTKLPYIEKIPPYTTWIFLDRNQRMAEDQSVVGRRRIYYDQCGSEALICSDSEEEITETEEEKHEFTKGEDQIIWTAFQEHSISEGVMNIVSQFTGGTNSEIEERYYRLKEKHEKEHNLCSQVSRNTTSEKSTFLEKSISAALDSFDNLFCRRCLVFDCRLHGCSQSLINPTEKLYYSSGTEENRKPCSDQCYLRLRAVKDLRERLPTIALNKKGDNLHLESKDGIPVDTNFEEPSGDISLEIIPDQTSIADKITKSTSRVSDAEVVTRDGNLNTSDVPLSQHENMGKQQDTGEEHLILHDSTLSSSYSQEPSKKRQRKLSALDVDATACKSISIQDLEVPDNLELQMTTKNTSHESIKYSSGKSSFPAREAAKDAGEMIESKEAFYPFKEQEQLESNCEWKPIEKDLFLKGIEIFGRNSCLISRNLLSGLKTCIEVSSYMHDDGAGKSHKSVAAPSSFWEDDGKAEIDFMDSDMPSRSRLLRRRGRARKLKYSWKSAGHPSILKRISGGKELSCRQYAPCGCQSMCGKQCSCIDNGTCCEKYCGCSKSCKNRFRGCHCAKSQCRSRQCPCFAAGRECDPDVCRNCWVSCGDGSLGEPPRRGDGQCGNMRLLLRQQQRILLAKSDVAGWGAFIKNPVNRNDYLGEYTGELISHREADKRGKIYDRANSSFLFDLNDQYVLDAYRKGDKLKFANHSSNPNCYAKVMLVAGDHRVGIFAKEHIEASEELFYDYRYGPDQAPAWARKPESSKRDDSSASQGRAKKHQSH